ncbi:hypothetical protein [Agromyces sp. SYSU T0242]|uniref:hypothetical protein n=1 Tax=Agromyces litoreus TaxID=3158561 RepID=UPI0033929E63
MITRLRRGLAAASATIALVGGLAACATQESTGSDAVMSGYRTQVVSIADSSAAGDYAEALGRLDALEEEVQAAVDDGSLDPDRAGAITDAIALVRADLDAAIAAATPEPAPAPEPEPDDDEDNSGPGNSDDSGNNGSGNSGSGNSDDKPGKGKGRDKGDD